MKRWQISRRGFLAGSGSLIGLPLLEQMMVSGSAFAASPRSPNLIVWHFPTSWTPTAGARLAVGAGSGTMTAAKLGPVFAPFAAANLLNELTIVTNITNPGAQDSIAGDHARGVAALLTCMHPVTGMLNVGPSMDIVASKILGVGKRIPAMQLGTAGTTQCEDGSYPYPDCYSTSWAAPGQPLPPERNPRTAFTAMFSGTTAPVTPPEIAIARKRLLYQKSILDHSIDESARLKAKLNPRDAAKVDQLQTNIRDFETRLAQVPVTPPPAAQCVPGTAPAGIPADIRDHLNLEKNLMVLGLQCGVTPVVSFSYANTVSEMQHTFLNTAAGAKVTDGWHIGITHHNGDPFKIAEQQAVNTWLVSQFADLAKQLKAVILPDGTTLLDNTIMVGVSDMGDQAHNHANMMPLLVGGAALGVKPGRLIVNTAATRLSNVYMGVLGALGVPATSFGDSNGVVSLTT